MIRPPPLKQPGKALGLHPLPRITIDIAVTDLTCHTEACGRMMPAGDAVHLITMPLVHLPVGFDGSQRTHEWVSFTLCPVCAAEEVERQKLIVRVALHEAAKGA